jgi:RNA polymerase sigma-70 factor (ECF subfamily)
MDDSLDDWFARVILPHEPSLVRYLTRMWPNRDDIPDLRQEAYVRVCEAAAEARPTSPKSFLFTIARNLMADRMRRARVVSIEARADMDAMNVLVDDISPERHATARQQLWHLASAFDALPARCREVLWMRRVEEICQREVADRLGITEGSVEKHVARAVRLLAERFYGIEDTAQFAGESPESKVEWGP